MSESFATALDTLGEILPSDPGRDAIHLATYAVIAGERLFPGQHIGLIEGHASAKAQKLIGIVDPFLPTGAHPGQMFWLVLYPRTITSLRHVWTHPDFAAEQKNAEPQPQSKEASEAWLRDFIKNADCPDYHTVIGKAVQIAKGHNDAFDDDYMHFNGLDAHGEIPGEFWEHFEIATGIKAPVERRAKYFSCSC